MAHFTYSGDPNYSDRDAVRFLVRDIGPTTWQLSDEEISFMLAKFPSPFYAAAASAEIIGANFTEQVRTKTVGALSLTYEVAATAYRELSTLLKDQAKSTVTIAAYAGGISESDKRIAETDSDYNRPSFYMGMHDHAGTSDIYRLHRAIDEAWYR